MKLWTRLGTASVAGLTAASMTLAAGAGAASQLSLKTGKTVPGFQLAQGGEGGEGGEGGTLENRSIRLKAGELILYPSGALHAVEPVTRGTRLAIVGWLRSYLRDPAQREILFDLELALREMFERDGKSGLFDRLVKTRTNLLRLWADD